MLFIIPRLMIAPRPPPNHIFAPAGGRHVVLASSVLRRHGAWAGWRMHPPGPFPAFCPTIAHDSVSVVQLLWQHAPRSSVIRYGLLASIFASRSRRLSRKKITSSALGAPGRRGGRWAGRASLEGGGQPPRARAHRRPR